MNAREIARAIQKIEDHDDLEIIAAAVNRQWRVQRTLKMGDFHRGDKVWFRTRQGRKVTGTVLKQNRTTIAVRETTTTAFPQDWRVSPNFLNHVEAD